MDFNTTIYNIAKFGGPKTWDYAERYLHINQKRYAVTQLNKKQLEVQKVYPTQSMLGYRAKNRFICNGDSSLNSINSQGLLSSMPFIRNLR